MQQGPRNTIESLLGVARVALCIVLRNTACQYLIAGSRRQDDRTVGTVTAHMPVSAADRPTWVGRRNSTGRKALRRRGCLKDRTRVRHAGEAPLLRQECGELVREARLRGAPRQGRDVGLGAVRAAGVQLVPPHPPAHVPQVRRRKRVRRRRR